VRTLKKLAIPVLLILALGLLAGCAHWVEFQTPAEFRGKKVKEDPPGTYVPWLNSGVKAC
jgi:hypothetical protein